MFLVKMWKKYYFGLVIICSFFLQGIANSLDKNTEKLSDLLVRKKRIIDKTPSGWFPTHLKKIPYIVNILKNGVSHCAGSILEPHIIVSAAICFRQTYPPSTFKILSGSSLRNNGTPHHILRDILHPYFDLAVAKIFPPIDIIHSLNKVIERFNGELFPEVVEQEYGVFSGWGCTEIGPAGNDPVFPEALMQTRLPIISEEACINSYKRRIHITDQNICTLDTTKRRATCIGDTGGPLVYKNQILGVMTFQRGVRIGTHADIFIKLCSPEIAHWINVKINELPNRV